MKLKTATLIFHQNDRKQGWMTVLNVNKFVAQTVSF